jgi:hypothetical protein
MLYNESMDSGGWARVLYDAFGSMEKLTSHKILPVAAPSQQRHLGCPASGGKQAGDSIRWKA